MTDIDAILLSVKPKYAKLLLSGKKRIELRRRGPKLAEGSIIVVYATAPLSAIVGLCIVQRIILASPAEIWESHCGVAGVNETEFWEYFRDSKEAVGLVVRCPQKFPNPLELKAIRTFWPEFTPPQSYYYLNIELDGGEMRMRRRARPTNEIAVEGLQIDQPPNGRLE